MKKIKRDSETVKTARGTLYQSSRRNVLERKLAPNRGRESAICLRGDI